MPYKNSKYNYEKAKEFLRKSKETSDPDQSDFYYRMYVEYLFKADQYKKMEEDDR